MDDESGKSTEEETVIGTRRGKSYEVNGKKQAAD